MRSGPSARASVLDRVRSRFGNLVDMAVDVGWSSLHDLIALASAMLSFALLGRTLGPEGFGPYAAIFGITGPLGALAWAGITLAVLQRTLREKDDPSDVASAYVTLTLVQSVGLALVGLLIGSLVLPLPTTTLMAYLAVELVILGLTRSAVSVIQAVEGFAASARINIASQVLRIVMLIGLYATGRLTVATLGVTWLVGQTVFAGWVLAHRLPQSGVVLRATRPSRPYVLTAGQLSLPNLATNIRSRGDQTVLVAYGHDADGGLYAAAFRIVTMAITPLRSMNNALFQRFLDHDDSVVGQHVRRSLRQAMVAGLLGLLIAGVVFVAAPLSTILIGDDFEESVGIIRWLLLFLPIAAVAPTGLNGLLGLGKVLPRAVVVIASAVLSLVLYLALIPSLSWRGAVVGTIVGETFLAVAGWVLLVRYQREHDQHVEREDVMRAAIGQDSEEPAR